MSEARKRAGSAAQETLAALGVEALDGEPQVPWNRGEAAIPFSLMAYFAEFLKFTRFHRLCVESCPLHCTSPNGSKLVDV